MPIRPHDVAPVQEQRIPNQHAKMHQSIRRAPGPRNNGRLPESAKFQRRLRHPIQLEVLVELDAACERREDEEEDDGLLWESA